MQIFAKTFSANAKDKDKSHKTRARAFESILVLF
jgi:hypothetical protein